MWERLSEALDSVDLEEWLSDYAEIKSAGRGEIRLQDCPSCGNDNFKVYVNTDKRVWICFVCDWGRGIGDAVILMAKVSARHPWDVRNELLALAPPAPVGSISTMLESAFDSAYEVTGARVAEDTELPGVPTFDGLTTSRVLAYALSRGLTHDDVKKLGLQAVGSLEMHKNFEEKTRKITGPFLVFPVRHAGSTVSWQGRKTTEKEPKYVSYNNIKKWLWPLDETLFSVYSNRLIVVEGVFDAIGFIKSGQAAVCTFGKSLSDAQLSLLIDLKPEELIFAWDLDASKEIMRAVKRVAPRFPKTFVASFDGNPAGKVDPGDMLTSIEARDWVLSKLEHAVDVRSEEFFEWQLKNQ